MMETKAPVYALYARVSHDDEVQDPEVQLGPMRRYCKDKGFPWIEYIDKETGRTIKRDDYQRAMAEMEKWDVFMVTLPDRLTREGPERGIEEVSRMLEEGKSFYIFLGGIIVRDRMTAITKMILRSMFTFAAFESDIISERTRAGIARKKLEISENGYTISKRTGKRITGLGRQPSVKISLEEILTLKDEGLSLQQIAEKLGSKKSTIHGILKRHFS